MPFNNNVAEDLRSATGWSGETHSDFARAVRRAQQKVERQQFELRRDLLRAVGHHEKLLARLFGAGVS